MSILKHSERILSFPSQTMDTTVTALQLELKETNNCFEGQSKANAHYLLTCQGGSYMTITNQVPFTQDCTRRLKFMRTLLFYYGLQQVYYFVLFFNISFYHEMVFGGNYIHVYMAIMQHTISPTQHRKMIKLTPKCLKKQTLHADFLRSLFFLSYQKVSKNLHYQILQN